MTPRGPRVKRAARIAGLLLLGSSCLYHAFLLFTRGFANVFTTVLLYSSLALLGFGAVQLAGRGLGVSRERLINLRVLLGTVFLCLLASDLYLRYGVPRYQSYEERKGQGFYVPVYARRRFLRDVQRWTESPGLWLRSRNTTRTESLREFTYQLVMNSEGIRDREHSPIKPPGVFRIVAMGDSFTEGAGAPFESSWPQQLHGILRERGCRDVEVISGGVSGADPFFEYALLERRLLKYRPDLVIVAVNTSDIEEHLVRGGMERFKEDGTFAYPPGPWWEWIYASSFVCRHVVHDVLGYDRLLLRPGERGRRVPRALDDIEGVLRSFGTLSELRGFRLLVVLHPARHETLERKEALAPVLARLAAPPPIATLDLLDHYLKVQGMDARNIDDYYWPVDTHHTPRGYRVFAEGVAARLFESGGLAPACPAADRRRAADAVGAGG